MTVQCLITSCIVQLNKSLKGLKLHWPNILYFSTGSILERKWDWSISLSLVCLCKYAFHKTSDQLTPTGYKFLALFLVDKINGRVTSQMFFCPHEDFFIGYLVFDGIRICHCSQQQLFCKVQEESLVTFSFCLLSYCEPQCSRLVYIASCNIAWL